MPAPLRISTNTTIHKAKCIQAEFKEARQLYVEAVEFEKALNNQIVAVI